MQTQTRFIHFPFILSWTFANLLAGFISGFLESNGFQFAATLIFAGAIASSLQWWVLRPRLHAIGWWPLASTVGWISGSLMVASGYNIYHPIVEFLWSHLGLWEVFWLSIVTAPVPFAGMAIAQSMILRQHHQISGPSIRLWILGSAIAGSVYGGVSASLCFAFCDPLPTSLVGLVTGGGWAVYGLITSGILPKIIRSGDG
ncbi:MAG: hypothetical protein VKJ64_14025 [Leptolyngbyaceae bacterium]|nr:hypothetical protein [Leptolyngbyaceae bacterium]